jgi:hypothetical protein
MSLKIRRSDWFIGDLEHYAAWYQSEASWKWPKGICAL